MALAWALAAATLAAQDPADSARLAPSEAAAQAPTEAVGVTVYAPSFFSQERPQTALDMLNLLPGFRVESGGDSGGGGPRGGGGGGGGGGGVGGGGNRGFGAGGNVLINGARPASKSDTLQDVLNRIPAASVERIELIRGGAPGIDMQGKSSVANVIRKAGGGLKGTVTVQTGVNDDGDLSPRVQLEAVKEAGARRIEGVFNFNRHQRGGGDSHLERIGPTGAPLLTSDQIRGGHGDSYEVTSAYETPLMGGKLRATLVASLSTGTSSETNTESFPAPRIVLGASSDENQAREYGLQYTRPILGGVEFEGTALRSSNQSGGQQDLGLLTFSQTRDTTETIGRGILRFPAWGRLTVDASSEVAKNTLDTRSLYLSNGVPTGLNNPVLGVEEFRTETAGTVTWRHNAKVRVELGARYETSSITTTVAASDNTLRYLKPRVLLSWTPNPANQVTFRAEKEVSQLSFNDYTASAQLQNGTTVSGNAGIVPSQTEVYELRYQWRKGRTSLQAGYSYRSRIDIIDRRLLAVDDVDSTTHLPVTRYFEINDNVGNGTAQSFGVAGARPLDDIGIKGGLINARINFTWSEMTDPTTLTPRPVPGPPPVIWMMQFTQDLPMKNMKWGISSSNFSKSTTYRPRELNTRESGPNLDVFAEYQIAKVGAVRIQLDNITNRTTVPVREVYGASGPDTRATSALDYIETRTNHEGRSARISLRRTF